MTVENGHGWRSRLDVWEALGRLLSGITWCKVSFRPALKLQVPAFAGIYILASSPPVCVRGLCADSLYNALYVGKSVNLRRRFMEHLHSPDWAMQDVKRVFSRQIEFWHTACAIKPAQLDMLESHLIHCLRPTANRQKIRAYITITPISAHSRKKR